MQVIDVESIATSEKYSYDRQLLSTISFFPPDAHTTHSEHPTPSEVGPPRELGAKTAKAVSHDFLSSPTADWSSFRHRCVVGPMHPHTVADDEIRRSGFARPSDSLFIWDNWVYLKTWSPWGTKKIIASKRFPILLCLHSLVHVPPIFHTDFASYN